MCGISGIVAPKISAGHKKLIQDIVRDQHARGPDYQDIRLCSSPMSESLLGHNRLSIIDLSDIANQPMWDYSERYCISYNGEIYNYLELRTELQSHGLHFKTKSDTEVILNAFAFWGIDCLQHLQGPFAFALFDKQTGEFWVCRDRFGVRPLFYLYQQNTFYFASSSRVLAKQFNLKINLEYVAKGLKYLVYEDGSDTTPYIGLHALAAGSYLHVKMDATHQLTVNTKIFYDLPKQITKMTHTLADNSVTTLLEKVNHAFEDSVQVRLRADVPLAISLSSGLDSSAIAAIVKNHHADTVGFSFGDPQVNQTEGPLVAKCARFLNIPMQYVWPSQQEMIDGLFKTLHAQDAPFSSLSVVAQYLLYARVQQTGVKVLLGGQGGDESFMGYRKFLLFQFQQFLKQKNYVATAKNFLQLIPMFVSEARSLGAYWRHRHRYSKRAAPKSILQLPESPTLQLNHTHGDLSDRQIRDITQFSLPTLLRYEDRNGMGNSIESRLPFMDYRLVELGVALPAAIKLRSGYAKWPIRKIMQNKLPNAIRLARYKRGFDIPLKNLLHAGLGKSIRSALHAHPQVCDRFLSQKIEDVFSDQEFLSHNSRMTEAISLLWLTSKEDAL